MEMKRPNDISDLEIARKCNTFVDQVQKIAREDHAIFEELGSIKWIDCTCCLNKVQAIVMTAAVNIENGKYGEVKTNA